MARARTISTTAVTLACAVEIRPAATGRYRFFGCWRSACASMASFRKYVPLAARQKAANAINVRPTWTGSVSTPAAPGAANTITFFTHCFGRASRRKLRTSEGRRPVSGASAPGVGAGRWEATDIARQRTCASPLRFGARRRRLCRPSQQEPELARATRGEHDQSAAEGLHAQGRRRHHRAVPRRASRQGRTRSGGVRRRRRGRLRARPRPGPDGSGDGALRAAPTPPARAVRRRGRAGDRACQARPPRARRVACDAGDGHRPRTRHRRGHDPLRSSAGVRAAGRERARRRPRPGPGRRSPRRAAGGRRPRRRVARRQSGGPVPEPTRRPRLHAGTLAGARLSPRPHRRAELSTDQEAPVSPTFTRSASPVDRVQADLLAVPVGAGRALGPGAEAVDAALDGELDAFMAEADFDGKPGQTVAVPTRGRLRAAAAMLAGVGAFGEVTADGVRRAAAAVARKATKAPSVATTLVDLADAAG